MGGFTVKTQSFSVYQAIDWICGENGSLQQQINGVRRIREMVEKNQSADVMSLGIPSRLVDLLELTQDNLLQVKMFKFQSKLNRKSLNFNSRKSCGLWRTSQREHHTKQNLCFAKDSRSF